MSLLDWIPAVSTTLLLGFVLWLLRSVISTRLRTSVQHEFDQKLEAMRATLRTSEESFKADLRAKEAQIAALRSGAMSGLASRQAALDKRRIEAVDQLWSAITLLAPAKAVSATMAVVKFEAAAKEAARNPKVREMFAAMGEKGGLRELSMADAAKARPFVSQLAWALFTAYQAIVSVAVIRLEVLKTGLDMPDVVNKDAVVKLITVALPHQAEFITKYDASAYHYLLDELESRLLEELQRLLRGVESDKASVEQAAAILKESERLMQSISQPTKTYGSKGDGSN
jgi:hypothetical protein